MKILINTAGVIRMADNPKPRRTDPTPEQTERARKEWPYRVLSHWRYVDLAKLHGTYVPPKAVRRSGLSGGAHPEPRGQPADLQARVMTEQVEGWEQAQEAAQ
jgi:hypothetical protein